MSTRNKNYIVFAIILAFIVVVVEFCNIPYLKSFQHQIYDNINGAGDLLGVDFNVRNT